MDWGAAGAVLGIVCIVVLALVAWRAVVDRDDARERLADALLEQVKWKTAAGSWRRLCVVTAGIECCSNPTECLVCRRLEDLERAECQQPV